MSFISDETNASMRKELELWVSIMSGDNIDLKRAVFNKSTFALNMYSLLPSEVGEKTAQELKEWWGEAKTTVDIKTIICSPMKVDGTPRNWSCGEFGSRWCDVIINRRLVRISFSSRKYNTIPTNLPDKNYIIEIDPSDSEVMTDEQIKIDKKSKVCMGCGYFVKTLKTECCGERYCNKECYEEDRENHLTRCAIAREMVAKKQKKKEEKKAIARMFENNFC